MRLSVLFWILKGPCQHSQRRAFPGRSCSGRSSPLGRERCVAVDSRRSSTASLAAFGVVPSPWQRGELPLDSREPPRDGPQQLLEGLDTLLDKGEPSLNDVGPLAGLVESLEDL